MSRGITLLIGRLPTISGELAGLAASARRVISMMTTRVCLLPPPLCPADGARVHVIMQISPSALSLLTTLSDYTSGLCHQRAEAHWSDIWCVARKALQLSLSRPSTG